jgi:hypothetical protein
MKTVRIGNAQAFWGDRSDAAAEMLSREPDIDYITLDYLAEVSMSILAVQRERDPEAGFAGDFIEVVRSLVPYWSSGGRCRLIANAGGLNPHGCADACRRALEEAGCRAMRIGIVTGDDVAGLLRESTADSASRLYRNVDTGAAFSEIRDRLVTANAYLGAAPIVAALEGGADIVITGRVADPSLTVAPCLHHFGWGDDDLDRLAGATVAGHLIECGTQVTGGISTDWLELPDAANIGFPIAEVAENGSGIITKPQGTGGRVTAMTVKEQLLYEIGDPERYISPDVTVSFCSLAIDDLGNDKVRVTGATGKPRPEAFKVSATYRDGFRSAGTMTIIGRNAAEKARRVGELVLGRVRDAGFTLRDSIVECLGGPQAATPADNVEEIVLRVAVESESREAVERFTHELMPFITAGPQGTTGYAEGRPRVHPVFRYWPCLIGRDDVEQHIEVVSSRENGMAVPAAFHAVRRDIVEATSRGRVKSTNANAASAGRPTRLYDIACARSGDKGSDANVGVIARRERWWEFLKTWLSAERVAAYFANEGVDSVDRYELPNLGALNFVIHGVLRRSLRTDAQGKALGQRILEMPLPEDVIWDER